MAFAISTNRSNASIAIADARRFPSIGVSSFCHSADLALTDSLQNQYCTSLGKNSLDNSCLGTII